MYNLYIYIYASRNICCRLFILFKITVDIIMSEIKGMFLLLCLISSILIFFQICAAHYTRTEKAVLAISAERWRHLSSRELEEHAKRCARRIRQFGQGIR